MIAGTVEEGICLLEFSDRRMLNTEYSDLKRYLKLEITEGENIHTEELRSQLAEYFNGTRKEFDLKLVATGTQFQQQVWQELMKIPYGTTRSYQQQADAIGKPGSVRAVANANGMNHIAIIIPCHRIIGSDGSLTGYGGGLKRKQWLIDHEKKHSGQAVDLSLF
jgi:AraC family transcriptional regulator, regulatory protein of adaptative response / methylated-DNA-[protein]-cysteine methyltransferase